MRFITASYSCLGTFTTANCFYIQIVKIFLIINKKFMALQITDSNFENEVLQSEKIVMVDFWAEWCGPCRIVGPIVDELAKDYEGKAVIGKVDVDENPGISMRYGIRNIPTILFLKNGEILDKQVGAVPKSVLEQKLKSHIQ